MSDGPLSNNNRTLKSANWQGFLIRLAANSVMLGLAIWVYAPNLSGGFWDNTPMFVFAALLLSVVNMFIRPLITFISLPMILLTLGLFTLVINGAVVFITLWLIPGLSMSFGSSIITGFMLSLINGLLNNYLEN